MRIARSLMSIFAVLCLAGCRHLSTEAGRKPDRQILLADNGQTRYVITLAADRSAPEQHAAQELARFLKEVTGAEFAIVTPAELGQHPAIAVGPGAARQLVPDLDLTGLGQDGIVIQSQPPHLILTGGAGAPRGTLYAVYTFLEDTVGCRWWTPETSTIPRRTTLAIPELKHRYIPCFEYRDFYCMETKNPDWSVRNKFNGDCSKPMDQAHGGAILYSGGFCHTLSNNIVPSAEFFPKHPEWFSEIGGQRVGGKQYCLTNPELLAFCIQWVKTKLREAPPEAIIDVSQNDGGAEDRCQCAKCLAIEQEEGGPSGPLLRFVNAVADAIKDDYPRAVIQTFAYQYTRKPPRLTQPRPNVSIRLCNIECSFAQPLDHDVNRTFAEDLKGWAAICQRLYIWDYITDLDQFMLPFPDLRVRGPNTKFLASHNVKGIFEQGSPTPGVALAELHSWVLAKLLWDPAADDRELIRQFVEGYYGPAAPRILEYIRLLHDTNEKTGYFMRYGAPVNAPYLTLDLLTQSETLFQKAEATVKDSPDLLGRVQLAHASIQYAVLGAWPTLRQEAQTKNQPWIFGTTPADLLNRFMTVCHANNVKSLDGSWAPLEKFRRKMELVTGPRAGIAPPEMCKALPDSDWVEFQEEAFSLSGGIANNEIRPDAAASNGKAVWIPATHSGWNCSLGFPASLWMNDVNQEWMVYVVVRVEKKGKAEGTAFAYGIWDPEHPDKGNIGGHTVALSEIKDDAYHVYEVAKTGSLSYSRYLWISPTSNPDNVACFWVDRIFMIRAARDAQYRK